MDGLSVEIDDLKKISNDEMVKLTAELAAASEDEDFYDSDDENVQM